MIKKQEFEEYADIQEQIKELEDKRDGLKPQITQMIIDDDSEEEGITLSNRGVFNIGHRKNYTYPQEVLFMDEQLKELKKKSEREGFAPYTETTYLIYKKLKNKAQN